MDNVVEFKRRDTPRFTKDGIPIIIKIVDGEEIECIDVDALTPQQFKRYFEQAEAQLLPPAG